MYQRSPQQTPRVLTIGLFGRRPLVATMLEAAEDLRRRDPTMDIRFLTGTHDEMEQARSRFERLAGRIDAAVFPGPMHFDLASSDGYRSVPSSFVHLTGAALYSTMLRSVLHNHVDITRISIDSLPSEEVLEAYRELQLSDGLPPIAPYTSPNDVEHYPSFHRDAIDTGRATCAFTTVLEVEDALRADGYPVVRITPTLGTVRDALLTAINQAHGTRLEEQQIAFIVVQLISPANDDSTAPSAYWQQQAGLEVHRMLLDEVKVVGATVARRSETQFVATTTAGGVDRLTAGLVRAPFPATRTRIGLPLAVGLGTGRTALSAEANALTAVNDSVQRHGARVLHVDADGTRTELTLDPSPSGLEIPEAADKARMLLRRVISGLEDAQMMPTAESGLEPVIEIGSEEIAQALGLTSRSGLRTIKQLVEAGYAWPMPPQISPHGGRPRQRFRLLTNKLPDLAATPNAEGSP